MARTTKEIVPVKDIQAQPPMVLASGSEAVSVIADQLRKLSPGQRTFLRLRFYYESDNECARAIQISPNTVKAWQKKDDFRAVYEQLLTQPLLHARAEMALLTAKAVHTIGELLENANPSVRLSAAEKVLKSRDSQMLTNNVKIEGGDDEYAAVMSRMRQMLKDRVQSPPPADDPDVVEVTATVVG